MDLDDATVDAARHAPHEAALHHLIDDARERRALDDRDAREIAGRDRTLLREHGEGPPPGEIDAQRPECLEDRALVEVVDLADPIEEIAVEVAGAERIGAVRRGAAGHGADFYRAAPRCPAAPL
jgi:hypothetical protein